mmetsp:Transcript_21232/g.59030  ORF Transcript_21232/g.59030 Transcript_21232/m.59030 type:complete len:246 (+) Transcript_21232:1414-2151(+)
MNRPGRGSGPAKSTGWIRPVPKRRPLRAVATAVVFSHADCGFVPGSTKPHRIPGHDPRPLPWLPSCPTDRRSFLPPCEPPSCDPGVLPPGPSSGFSRTAPPRRPRIANGPVSRAAFGFLLFLLQNENGTDRPLSCRHRHGRGFPRKCCPRIRPKIHRIVPDRPRQSLRIDPGRFRFPHPRCHCLFCCCFGPSFGVARACPDVGARVGVGACHHLTIWRWRMEGSGWFRRENRSDGFSDPPTRWEP